MNKSKEQIDQFFEHLQSMYDIESREEIEKQAENWDTNNPLIVALHYMWKRDPQVKELTDYIDKVVLEGYPRRADMWKEAKELQKSWKKK